jgi:hypothetical protein
MPIAASDIKKYLSGGAANSDPNASLGGQISSTEITDNTLHNLFDKVTGPEAEAGDIEYRAIFIKNTHATLTYEDVVVYISSNTPSADTTVAIALADEAVGTDTIETVANESTAPVGPTFSSPSSAGTGLSIGNIAPGEMKGIWVRWTVTEGAAAVLDEVTIAVSGNTNP